MFTRAKDTNACAWKECLGIEGKSSKRSIRADIAILSEHERNRGRAKSIDIVSSEDAYRRHGTTEDDQGAKIGPIEGALRRVAAL